jgi:hypothetical protein
MISILSSIIEIIEGQGGERTTYMSSERIEVDF